MDLLVSLCNRDEEHPEALVSVDSATGLVLPLEIEEKGCGAMGLCRLADTLFLVIRLGLGDDGIERSRLYSLDAETLVTLARYDFELGRDVHSLWPRAGRLYAVSTGTDELLELELDGVEVTAERVFWRPEPAGLRADCHHLNAVSLWSGSLTVSGFGLKPSLERDWKEAEHGFVCRLDDGERLTPLYQPHSLLETSGGLLVCESPRQTVHTFFGDEEKPATSERLGAYTRGLALTEEGLWVGLSQGRQSSKSRAVINNLAVPSGSPAGRCGLALLEPESLAFEHFVDLSAYGREVYDILPVDRRWPTEGLELSDLEERDDNDDPAA